MSYCRHDNCGIVSIWSERNVKSYCYLHSNQISIETREEYFDHYILRGRSWHWRDREISLGR